MERNEPSTEEIVRALRCDGDMNNCVDCPFADLEIAFVFCDQDRLVADAADRLESQARELSGIAGELEKFKAFHERYAEQTSKKYVDDICALTARAERAERERDAAFDLLQDMRGCDECKHLARTWREEPCNRCRREYSFFEPCGQSQDGGAE